MATFEGSAPMATARGIARIAPAAYFLLPYLVAAYIAYILLWYLPFKFAPDSYLFQVLEDWVGLPGFEPYFRYFTGGVEAVASLLLLIPGLQVAGALLAFGTMSGAIFFHVATPLGVDPYNDGGKLFTEACTVWLCALAILVVRRHEILPLVLRLVTDPRFALLTRARAEDAAGR
jgi:DoxX-like family